MVFSLSIAACLITQTTGAAPDLTGRWLSRIRGGPDVRGLLRIRQTHDGLVGEIAGKQAAVARNGEEVRLELPGNEGGFRGAFSRDKSSIEGHWIQRNGNLTALPLASPLTLRKSGKEWVGEPSVIDDLFNMYLVVSKAEDGTLKAYFRNPERNLGILLRADHLEVSGSDVKLIGGWGGSKKMQTLQQGQYDAENQVLHLYDPNGGMTFDYQRVNDNEPFDVFYPRGRKPAPYKYTQPIEKEEGWKVATPEEVGLSRSAIETFGRALTDLPDTSVHDTRTHALLIARHGKLVVEEYFHGHSSDRPHDTRSASKTVMGVLTGMAMFKDPSFRVDSSAFEIMGRTSEPEKNAITVENLLSMSSGLEADDSNDDSVGREDTMMEQKENKDWFDYTMKLPVIRKPGEKAVYASAQINFLGGVVAKKTGKWLPDLFRENFAKPLNIKRYHFQIAPNGEAYMGGGMYWYPREFLKMGQLMLNDGTWNGKRLLSSEYVKKSVEPRYKMGTAGYGYTWWVFDYPYQNRTTRAFYAGGNGGQIVMVFPEFDMVLGAFGGNYSDSTTFTMQREFVPKYVLPMITDSAKT